MQQGEMMESLEELLFLKRIFGITKRSINESFLK